MKTLLLSMLCMSSTWLLAQVTYNPVAVTGYSMDAIAETSPAMGSTSGSIDGSDYVLYSAAYGAVFTTNKGLPNSGIVTSGTRTYQLNPYNGNNTCYIMAGQKDSLSLSVASSYSALSLLGLATEGPGNMNVTVRFTDGTNQVFNGLVMPDWFNNPNAILSGIDRTGRITNTPDYQSTNPRLYAVDLVLTCANRLKLVQKIVIQNTTSNPRICVVAVSAAALPTFTVNPTNACFAMTNGKATIVSAGGVPAFTYTWTSSPVQNTVTATNLPPGTYTATINDAAGCTNTVSTTVGQPTAALTTTIAATSPTLCTGKTTTLTTSGATTYTWSSSASTATAIISPTSSATYSVSGTTAAGCNITGSINITVNPLPVISFSLTQNMLCTNTPTISLNATPAGGTYSGAGITGTVYSPATTGVGTHTIAYSYTNTNGCSATAIVSSTVNVAPVVSFSVSQNTNMFCPNSDVILLVGSPNGGIFSGTGVTGTVFTPSQAGIGTFTITYAYTNSSNCTSNAASTVTVSVCTGIEELELTGLNVYPNPGKGEFTIHTAADLQISLINETGQVVRSLQLKSGDNTLQLKDLPAGIYFMTGQNNQQILKQKLVILN